MGMFDGVFRSVGLSPSQNRNAQKGKDANKGDYKKGNGRDNSKTHTKSGQGRSGGRGGNGGRR